MKETTQTLYNIGGIIVLITVIILIVIGFSKVKRMMKEDKH